VKRILHYTLGFPPYRTGGLTKYSVDLMFTQQEQGHIVGLLWPGQIQLLGDHQKIKSRKSYRNIMSFEILNPLPIPMDEGIIDTKHFMKSGDKVVYEKFLSEFKPDVLHIHTLMGLHKELVEAANTLKIRTIFTTHDYFGICSKVTLFHDGAACECDHECRDCVKCNQYGLSMMKIAFLQSPLYRNFKNLTVVKMLRRRHRQYFFEEKPSEAKTIDYAVVEDKVTEYRKLREFYIDILRKIDVVHFNSTVSEVVYKSYFTPKNSRVESISHREIKDNRRIKEFNSNMLRITYLGPAKPFKGYLLLKKALDELWNDGQQNYVLRIYNNVANPSPYMIIQDSYQYSELKDIFDHTDLLVAPSACYETFGFTVLEALSYGVPVIVTENVGAKDLIKNNFGVVCIATKNGLKDALKSFIGTSKCMEINMKIASDFNVPLMAEFDYSLYN
jgi:glycosyltransferase involved in cell wall biosynthesis